MVVNARLEWGPAWLVSIAWLLAGSRAVNNCARHLVWITFAALCCRPRAVGSSWGMSAGRGGEVPFVRSCQVGGFQPLALSAPAAWWAAWMDGGALGRDWRKSLGHVLWMLAIAGLRWAGCLPRRPIGCWCGGCGRLQAQATLSKWH